MRTTLRKLGHDAVVRLPPEIMATAGIGVGSDVEVQANAGRIVIEVNEASPTRISGSEFLAK